MKRLIGMLTLALLACGKDATGPGTPPPPPLRTSIIVIITGNAQTDTVTKMLPVAIAARVTDSVTLKPQPGTLINWVVVQGGGSVFAGAALTDSDGIARERWTLGPHAGTQTLEARAVDPKTGEAIVFTHATATALPGPLAYAGFTADSLLAFGDVAVSFPVSATDSYGNPVTSPLAQVVDTGFGAVADGNTWAGHRTGLAHFVLGTDTLRTVVGVPEGKFRSVRTRGDTTWTETGTLAYAGIAPAVGAACTQDGVTRWVSYDLVNALAVQVIGAGAPDTVVVGTEPTRVMQPLDYQGTASAWYFYRPLRGGDANSCFTTSFRASAGGHWRFAFAGVDADSVTVDR